MRTTGVMRVAVMALVSVACATGWGDSIFNGTSGALITGEDGSGKTFQDRQDITDDVANTTWTVTQGSIITIGSKKYLYAADGYVTLADVSGTWLKNAIQVTSARRGLSITVYNNGTTGVNFLIYVNQTAYPAAQSNPTYSPRYSTTTYDDGQLITKTSALLNPGESQTFTWDLFDTNSWATLPMSAHNGGTRRVPVAGDWLSRFCVRVYLPGSNTGAGPITDVQLNSTSGTPAAPTNLTATAAGATQVNLRWKDNSNNESTFRIERKTGSGGTYSEIGTTGSDMQEYSDNTCSGATTYYYRVRARNSSGDSSYSNEANATTYTATTANFYDYSTGTVPHSHHIVMELVDDAHDRPSAEYDWLAGHYDWVFDGNGRTAYHTRNANIMWSQYALILTVIQAGNDLSGSYYPDMQTWYAAHPQYTLENAFLHKSGARMTKTIWGSDRWIMNPGDPGLIAYDKDRLGRFAANDDFEFIDEYGSSEIDSYAGSDEYPVLTNLENDEVSLLSALHVSLGKILQINTSQYTADLDKRCVLAAGGTHMELSDDPRWASSQPTVWTFQEGCVAGGAAIVEAVSPYTYGAIVGMTDFPAGNEINQYGRMRMAELASYYMAVPTPCTKMAFTYFIDTPFDPPQWIKAIEVNVGAPQAARYTYQTGTDPRGRGYTVYARDFDKALVLYRPSQGWDTPQYFDDSTAVTVNLPGGETWKQLFSNGMPAGNAVTSFSLRQAEAMIMMKVSKLGTPAAPAKLKATAAAYNQINLSWLDYSTDESTFRIERKTGSGGTYSEIGTVNADVTTYSDTTCSGSTTYFYRVRARNSDGTNSSYSNEDNATTPAPPGVYIFNGTTAAFATGEDGSGKTFMDRQDRTDDVANTAWTLERGSTTTVGGKTYLYDYYGKTILTGNNATWLNNAVQITSARGTLSITVYNNDTSAHVFQVWVEQLDLPGGQSNQTYSPRYSSATSGGDEDGKLVTRTTSSVAAGSSATVTWDLFSNSSYVNYPWASHGATPGARTSAPVAGDWITRLAPRVQIGGNNTDVGLVTDVKLGN